jgi:eukaryotic-like serine/threonine-protein kinase
MTTSNPYRLIRSEPTRAEHTVRVLRPPGDSHGLLCRPQGRFLVAGSQELSVRNSDGGYEIVPSNKLDAVLQHAKLVTPSPVALRVVNTASNPNCSAGEIAEILSQDPVLCGKVLKAANSNIFGGGQPIATVARAVVVMGLNPIRSLVLGLSLPTARAKATTNPAARDFWINAAVGGILARELSSRCQGPSPGYDLVAGLLRDLGFLLLVQNNPSGWDQLQHMPVEKLLNDPCGAETEIFGLHHVEVTTALLKSWKLPEDVIQPILWHHRPELCQSPVKAWRQRAEILHFVEWLVRLDAVAETPELLKTLLSRAEQLFGMDQNGMVEFLGQVSPKIDEIKKLFELDTQNSKDYSGILSRGCKALNDLSFRAQLQGLDSEIDTALLNELGSDPQRTVTGREKQENPSSKTPPDDGSMLLPNAWMESIVLPSIPRFNSTMLTLFPDSGCLIDSFEVKHELGRGAMGIVYAGYDHNVHREVAIKILSPEYASSKIARQRFQREARTLAAIQHQNIIGIYTLGIVDTLPYLAMEFVHGGSLEDLVEGIGPLPLEQIIDYGMQIAMGLNVAHQRGIIHRDIKPANIMIEAISRKVKIGDFGIACGLDNLELTGVGALVGSPLFLAPEQIENAVNNSSTDLFSVGSVLYYMCTGVYPFAAKTMPAVVRLICEANPLPPQVLRSDLPEWLNTLVLDLLRRRPEDRLRNAAGLFQRLAEHQLKPQYQLQVI